jgi:tripartite-type tricarboxylate transporter receptor subunit TctC
MLDCRKLGAAVLALALSTFATQARAADWPAKPVRIVVPYAAGGTADTLGRLAAQKLTEALGQQFVVDNKPGAGGLLGSDLVAHSAPDGYNLVVSGIASHVIAPALNPNTTFDPMKDFTHIVLLGGPPDVLAVNKDSPAKDLKGFIELAKSSAVSYGTPGIGTHGHLVAELLQKEAGFKMTSVPYRGASLAVTDIMSGQLQAGCFTLRSAGEQIHVGTLRGIAVTTKKRLAEYPQIPTFAELGYPNLIAITWFSLSGPAGLSPDIVNKINQTVIKGFQAPDVRKHLEPEAIDPEPLTPAEFTEFVKKETLRWAPLAKSLGVKAD